MAIAKASLRMLAFFLLCCSVVPVQAILLLFHDGKHARWMPYIWMNGVCRIFNIRVDVQGTPYTDQQTIYTSNHLSYLDIPVIGSILKVRFVSRKDAGEWPFFGYLVKLGQTAFVERSRSSVKGDANAVNQVIDQGYSLVIFPEGTSTDGVEVLDFKSSLFSLAMREDIPDLHIQPITLSVLSTDGKTPETQSERDVYAWHRNLDTAFFVHLWQFAQHQGTQIRVSFHDPFPANLYKDRKKLAKTCHDTVSNGLTNLTEKSLVA